MDKNISSTNTDVKKSTLIGPKLTYFGFSTYQGQHYICPGTRGLCANQHWNGNREEPARILSFPRDKICANAVKMGKDQELQDAARTGNVAVIDKLLSQRFKRAGPLALAPLAR